VNAVLEAQPETPSYVIGIVENKIVRNPLAEAVELVSSFLFSPPSLSCFSFDSYL